MTAVVAGLPRSWQIAPSIIAAAGPRSRPSMRCARLVDDHQRVHPHVAFGMPFGLLRAPDERVASRATADRRRRDRARARGRSTAARPAAAAFRSRPRCARPADRRAESRGRARCVSSSTRQLESRRELQRAQHAQAVVAERRADRRRAAVARRGRRRPSNGSMISPVSGSREIALIGEVAPARGLFDRQATGRPRR